MQSTFDLVRAHPHQCIKTGSDAQDTYDAAHDATSSTACSTGANMLVGQARRTPDSAHEFTIQRLGLFFTPSFPSGTITVVSAVLRLKIKKQLDAFGPEDWTWTLSIRKNSNLSDPGGAGGCPTSDYPTYLDGLQLASKYADDLTTSYVWYEFSIAASAIPTDGSHLKLALLSSDDLSDIPPSLTDRLMAMIRISDTPQLEVIYNLILAKPVVTTNIATNITSTSATLNGEITDTGGENPYERGFEWAETQDTPMTNSWTETGSFGTGTFSHGISGLDAGKTYYYRAKARNSPGWGYGAVREISTTSPYVFPSEAITRVTNLIHRYSPGNYTLEMALGEVTSDFGLPQYTTRPQPSVPEPELEPEVPPYTGPPGPPPGWPPGGPPRRPTPVTITCPAGEVMMYHDWDFDKQNPYCRPPLRRRPPTRPPPEPEFPRGGGGVPGGGRYRGPGRGGAPPREPVGPRGGRYEARRL